MSIFKLVSGLGCVLHHHFELHAVYSQHLHSVEITGPLLIAALPPPRRRSARWGETVKCTVEHLSPPSVRNGADVLGGGWTSRTATDLNYG